MPYQRILEAAVASPWALDRRQVGPIASFLLLKHLGLHDPTSKEARDARDQGKITRTQSKGDIAILAIKGVIANRAEAVDDISGPGGTSMEKFGQRLAAVLDDDQVAQIVLDVDSGGGATPGVAEAANLIREGRERKPITAVINSHGNSAAYWLASQASEVVIVPSGEAGSIGVFSMHTNIAEQAKLAGIEVEFVAATDSPNKTEFNPFEPMSDSAREFLLKLVDDDMAMFVADVAKGRGVTKAKVLKDFGKGRAFNANDALTAGMVDRIDTLPNVISALQSGARRKTNRRRAEMALSRY